ncbi:hypothetical protein [Burkholderia vietnamiensis]|uniref:hypothetical protein n=1 Tax=Burkholderia vietnamiensis TaxID=60552 RepID=UPI001CF497ED|nr:hypothetical protein [Burkholderia vietnamiensis]MCA8148108.1 hypothetical protein [Burkholderia vietnamiensis]
MRPIVHLFFLLVAVLLIGLLSVAQHIGRGHLASVILLTSFPLGMAGTALYLAIRDRVKRT